VHWSPNLLTAGGTTVASVVKPFTVPTQCVDGTLIRNASVTGTALGLLKRPSVMATCYRAIAGQTYLCYYLTDNSTRVTGWPTAQYVAIAGSGALYAC
jgi:hypothetical protein